MGTSALSEKSFFDQFLDIDTGCYREIVHFYEDFKMDLLCLDSRPRFIMQVCYVEALFEMGKYKEVLMQVDEAIENAIIFDYSVIDGVDVYYNLIFKKAVALNHLGVFNESMRLTRQLLSIDPNEPYVRYFYKSNIIRQSHRLVVPTRVFFISGLLTTAFLMSAELLIIRPFFMDMEPITASIRNYVFLFAIIVFVTGEISRLLLNEWQCRNDFNNIQKEKKMKSGMIRLTSSKKEKP